MKLLISYSSTTLLTSAASFENEPGSVLNSLEKPTTFSHEPRARRHARQRVATCTGAEGNTVFLLYSKSSTFMIPSLISSSSYSLKRPLFLILTMTAGRTSSPVGGEKLISQISRQFILLCPGRWLAVLLNHGQRIDPQVQSKCPVPLPGWIPDLVEKENLPALSTKALPPVEARTCQTDR